MKPTPVKLDHNPGFTRAFDLMNSTNKCLFITGKAGTGKSTLLDYFVLHTVKKPVVLAPTGVAALNVGGQTIHRFFNFYIDITPEKIKKKEVKPRNKKLYKQLEILIIDEVSMLRADLLDCIDTFLRLYGPVVDAPFGGVQMVFVGDLYQLPPVVGSAEREIFETLYDSPYFFSAHALRDMPIEMVELTKVYRQKDQDFVDLLNRIRNNSVEAQDIDHLNTRLTDTTHTSQKSLTISLTATNARADEINEEKLSSLKGRTYHAAAEISGSFEKEYYPTATDLRFKIGAQIMMLNNDSKNRWVNGSIGIIDGVKTDEDGSEYLSIILDGDHEPVEVYPFMWEVFKVTVVDGHLVSEAAGTFTQYPFRLAWAVTIHKSQGKTFDHVVIDIGRGAFATGQMYVALSRCTSFEGIRLLTPIKPSFIRTDHRIYKFMTRFAYEQSATEMPTDDKVVFLKQAIKNKTKLSITYLKPNDTRSERVIVPLEVGMDEYKGKKYLGLRAFCTMRKEERMFRVDRIIEMEKATG